MLSQTFKFSTVFFLILVMGLSTSCLTTFQLKSKPASPGQIKKVTGSKSAKPYAPGQQKKKNK